ncbi:hypothetical protein FHG55_10685 [Pseudomonas jessenii]|uniref:Uncharacterized protein n=1 Tax=Pseudomonas jessenii TaxID=77298 RepID=A0A5C4L0F8_PSEJE|nr:hypothetical protein FHG55_10685 [Pseudomonas jessenii]
MAARCPICSPPARSSASNASRTLETTPPVGAGLLAKASCQSLNQSTDPPLSRASPLPHRVFQF